MNILFIITKGYIFVCDASDLHVFSHYLIASIPPRDRKCQLPPVVITFSYVVYKNWKCLSRGVQED